VPQAGVRATLTGTVRLLSDQGGGVLSNGGAQLISDAGGGLVGRAGGGVIANNGGNVIANNGGNVIANNGGGAVARPLRLQQAARGEAVLSEADVYLTDAAGKVLVDDAGAPLRATSDGQGRFTLTAALPGENLVLRVPLRQGGALAALLVRSDRPSREVALDTAATLGAAYVLDQYVKGRQNILDKLPEAEADQLRSTIAAALPALTATPSFETRAVVEATAALRRSNQGVDRTLEAIKVLLLGQERLGEGKAALDVPLVGPSALIDDGSGGFLIAEERPGRLRRVGPDGVLTTLLDRLQGRFKANVVACSDIFRTAAGDLYMTGTTPAGHGIHRLTPDGQLVQVLGTKARGRSELGRQGHETPVCPETVWVDPDGTLWFGEDGKVPGGFRVLTVGTDGAVREPAPAKWDDGRIVGLVRGRDGAMYAYTAGKGNDFIMRLAPGATAWSRFCKVERSGVLGDLANASDGGFWVSEDLAGKLSYVGLDGQRQVVLDHAAGSPIKRPADLLPQADGSVLVIDAASNLVHEVRREGSTRLVAGLDGRRAFDPERGVALNSPQGLALDATGRLLIAESGGHAIQAWTGAQLVRVAGGTTGSVSGTQPLGEATFNGPVGVVPRTDGLLVMDRENSLVRMLDEAASQVRVLAGPGSFLPTPLVPGAEVEPTQANFIDGFAIVGRKDGPVFWTASYRGQVVKLDERGRVRLLAGTGTKGDSGDGGPAAEAQLTMPAGLAFSPDGALLVADVAALRIRRVRNFEGEAPVIEAFAGLPREQAVGALEASYRGVDEGKPASEVAFAAPVAMCFDGAGLLYVAEFGTAYTHLLPNLPGGAPMLDVEALPVLPPRIRRIDKAGRITTIVGPGGAFLTDPTAPDALVLPTSMIVDGQGRLVVADAGANVVRFFPVGSR
jgi:sugar lactone lactonase YvrE